MKTTPIPDQRLGKSSKSVKLDLTPYFDVDAITGSVVRVQTNAGGNASAFYLELFDRLHPTSPAAKRTTPLTVANFLGYVNKGAYNGVIFHRLVKGEGLPNPRGRASRHPPRSSRGPSLPTNRATAMSAAR